MLDVVDRRRQGPLKLRGNAAGHLVGGKAGVLPDHGNHRNPDVWKDIDRCTQGREWADDKDDQREDDECIGTPQRNADEGNHSDNALKLKTSPSLACAVGRENGRPEAL